MFNRLKFTEKIITPRRVSEMVQSDTDIIVAMCANEPQTTLHSLHFAAPRVKNVQVFSCLTLDRYPFFFDPEMKGHFMLSSWFHGAPAREAQEKNFGTVSFVPNMLHRAVLDRLSVRRPHIFIGSCTPPDQHGFVSLGCNLVYEKHALKEADIVIMEINPHMPRTYGDTHVHVDEVHWFTESEREIPAIPTKEPDEIEKKIGEHIATLVPDGATIQLGIGGIPNAAAHALKEKNDLGVHTEMFVDSMMDLYLNGNINNSQKSFYPGKFVCTFAMGRKELYPWLNENMSVEFKQGEWCNDPSIVRKNSRMTSINTCMQVDLTGQVASEGIGGKQWSGTGGQADTAVGAKEGHDGLGKSIIACRSTAKGGTLSTIITGLVPGTPVTLHRSHTDFVVTEFGIASLRGKTLHERALELIKIAHPDFRDELKESAKELKILTF